MVKSLEGNIGTRPISRVLKLPSRDQSYVYKIKTSVNDDLHTAEEKCSKRLQKQQ